MAWLGSQSIKNYGL